MADVTSIKIANTLVPQKDCGEAFAISANFALAADLLDNGERAELFEFQRDGVILAAAFEIDAGLGASTTLKLQKENVDGDAWVDLSAASTANTAEREEGVASVRVLAGEKIVVLLGGADQSVASNMEVDVLMCHNPVVND